MTLQPSRRDVTGPPSADLVVRNVTNLASIVRHHGTNLRGLNPGMLGGTRATPRPVPYGPSQIVGGDGGSDADDILFEDDDYVLATVAGTATLVLTYEPLDDSLIIFWNGLRQRSTNWTLDGQTVTFTDTHVHVGDEISAYYAYIEAEDVPDAATLALRGTSAANGTNGPALSSLALPAGTVVGDLVVISAESNATAALVVTDPRFEQVDYMWIGFATDLTAIAASAAGGFGSHWSIACDSFQTNAVAWTAAATSFDGSMVDGDTLALGTVDNVAAAVVAIRDGHSTVSGVCGVPTGWSAGADSGIQLSNSRVDYWSNAGVIGTSPAGPTTFNGGAGAAYATVVGLIGP